MAANRGMKVRSAVKYISIYVLLVLTPNTFFSFFQFPGMRTGLRTPNGMNDAEYIPTNMESLFRLVIFILPGHHTMTIWLDIKFRLQNLRLVQYEEGPYVLVFFYNCVFLSSIQGE